MKETKARIIQHRRGRYRVHLRYFLIEIDGVTNKSEAGKFVGKDVVWKSPAEKSIKGKIAAPHGNRGVVRAIFEKNLPGQAVGTSVEIK